MRKNGHTAPVVLVDYYIYIYIYIWEGCFVVAVQGQRIFEVRI